jgi:hypothetical protein
MFIYFSWGMATSQFAANESVQAVQIIQNAQAARLILPG